MGKKFKGKTCVYCGKANSSQTGDHIFAREFFLPNRRNSLPQVPACRECNNEKSGLEHYLTAILPFAGRHADAFSNLEKMIPPRLEKNRKLLQQISRKREYIWEKENRVVRLSMKIPFNSSKLSKLFCFIVKGLMWHHWNVLIAPNTFVRAGNLIEVAEIAFQNLFNGNAKQRVRINLGDGTIQYEGVQGVDTHNQFSIWKFTVYGGIKLDGDPRAPFETPKLIWGLTGTSKIIPDLWAAQ
jgi:hypothetical protein